MALILASSSPIRRQMLAAAGVPCEVIAPEIDESALKQTLSGATHTARALAEAKAECVSSGNRDAWVIGSDSLVAVDGRLFDKPRDRDEAKTHLQLFSGKTMTLTSAVALARGARVDWVHADVARLHVRHLSGSFISAYLDAEWPAVGYCVGVFRLEGPGVQLFERIEGDHFTILGMPLLPLLGALRERQVISS